jgi:deoxyadenosine/deoxycytidine kinase
MTLRIKGRRITVNKFDALQLSLMAQAVLENRPSFRGIKGEMSGQEVFIYTECAKEAPHWVERLIFKTPDTKIHLTADDKVYLERILNHGTLVGH